MLTVNVLGPLEVWANGKAIAPSAKKLRQVLALLAMHAGQPVSVATIIEELWGSHAPRSAVATLQTYIMGLRRQIRAGLPADDAMNILASRPGVYMLEIAPENVDEYRFRELAAAGERAMTGEDHATAARLLGRALDCWRGNALVDVQIGSQLDIEVARLKQSRLAVHSSRIEADLQLGRHHQLLGELAELNARYPMHEKFCTQYMTALTVCGQKWRALDVFLTLRKTLVGELGVEPSFSVQRLQRAILRSDLPVAELPEWELTISS